MHGIYMHPHLCAAHNCVPLFTFFFLLFSFLFFSLEHEKPATQQAKYIIEYTSCIQWMLAQSEVFQAEARKEMIHTLYVLLLLALVTVSDGRTLLSSL